MPHTHTQFTHMHILITWPELTALPSVTPLPPLATVSGEVGLLFFVRRSPSAAGGLEADLVVTGMVACLGVPMDGSVAARVRGRAREDYRVRRTLWYQTHSADGQEKMLVICVSHQKSQIWMHLSSLEQQLFSYSKVTQSSQQVR